MANFVMTRTFLSNSVQCLVDPAASPPLQSASLHLFDNNFTPVETMVISDLNEASFPGYSSQGLTWIPPTYYFGPWSEADFVPLIFTNTDTVNSYTIYGYYVLDAGGALVGAGLFSGSPLTLGPLGTLPVYFILTIENVP